jgi:hypothetical protein
MGYRQSLMSDYDNGVKPLLVAKVKNEGLTPSLSPLWLNVHMGFGTTKAFRWTMAATRALYTSLWLSIGGLPDNKLWR